MSHHASSRHSALGSPRARRFHAGVALLMVAAVAACAPGAGGLAGATGPKATEADPDTKAAVAVGYSEASHAKGADANDALVFPQASVQEFRIDISAADWAAMEADMTKLYGARGQGGGMGQPGGARPDVGASGAFPGGGQRPPRPDMGASGAFPGGLPPFDPGASFPAFPMGEPGASGAFPGGPGGGGGFGGGPLGTGENPMWVQGTVHYQGKAWPHVGVRFKGNSSLSSAWRGGTNRIPFKLDFDQWEKEYPAVLDQRFWGHKQLALSTNFSDPSGMRETLAYGLLAQLGLPSAKTGFYEVVLNHGGVVERLGVYTAVEVIDDTAVKRHFGKDKGNIYEGDGQAVSLALGTRDRIPDSFQKENNEESDWSDLQKLYDVLHDPERTTNAAAWRAKLEAVFNVDGFLEWLALAAALQHWDTYGGMAHNFYLYAHHDTGRLEWISWDHNLILSAMGGAGGMAPPGQAPAGLQPPAGLVPPDGMASAAAVGGGRQGGGGGMGRVSLDRSGVGDNWPLISFLVKDPVYLAKYHAHLRAISQQGFTQAELNAKVDALAAVLAPAMARNANGSSEAFTSAVASLKQAIATQVQAVATYLSTRP